MELRKVSKKKAKLRIGLSGASGFGKTYSALLMAYGITSDWNKIAIIDTENGSADLYENLGSYNVIQLLAPYTPERYNEAIKMAENAGIECLIIDSITHEWDGEGGCLEIQTQLGGRYQDWAKVTPRHNSFIQTILKSNCHIITCVRRKQDYEMTTENGKSKVQKVGTKEVTREGFEYELTVNLEFVNDLHLIKASKDRTQLFMNKPEFIITSETGKMLIDWANSGVDEVAYLIDSLNDCKDRNSGTNLWNANKHLQTNELVINAFKSFTTKYRKEKEELTEQHPRYNEVITALKKGTATFEIIEKTFKSNITLK